MKTREQAEQRALELYPKYEDADNCGSFPINVLRKQQQDAYLKCWEDMQDNKLREAAERVVELGIRGSLGANLHESIKELEKALK